MDSPLRLSTDRVYEGGDQRCSSEEAPGGGEVEVAVEVWVWATLIPSASSFRIRSSTAQLAAEQGKPPAFSKQGVDSVKFSNCQHSLVIKFPV